VPLWLCIFGMAIGAKAGCFSALMLLMACALRTRVQVRKWWYYMAPYILFFSSRHVLLHDRQLLFRGTPRWKDLSCCNSHLWDTRMSAHCLWSWLLWCICLPPFSMLLQRVHSPLLLMAVCRLPVCFSMLRVFWHKEGVMVGLHGHLFGVASAHPPSTFLSVAII